MVFYVHSFCIWGKMMNNTKQQVNLQAQKPKFSSKVTLLRVNEHFFSSGGKLDKQHSFPPKKDFLAFKAKEKFAFYSSPFIFKSDTRSKKSQVHILGRYSKSLKLFVSDWPILLRLHWPLTEFSICRNIRS